MGILCFMDAGGRRWGGFGGTRARVVREFAFGYGDVRGFLHERALARTRSERVPPESASRGGRISIAPFMTHEGSAMGRAVDDIRKICRDSKVLTALPIRGGSVKKSEKTVENWLRQQGAI